MKGKFLEVVNSWRNIAPILDAVKADTDGSGLVSLHLVGVLVTTIYADVLVCRQPHIVTCSGGKNTGSLRVIRNGADFQEKAIVDGLDNMTGLWALRSHSSDK